MRAVKLSRLLWLFKRLLRTFSIFFTNLKTNNSNKSKTNKALSLQPTTIMNSNETLTLLNSELDSVLQRRGLQTDAKNKGIQFYTNSDYIFSFPNGADAVSLENDAQFNQIISDLHNEILMKSSELAGTHQEPTQLWQELRTLELVASRLLAALLNERSLRKDQRRAIQYNLEALAEFVAAKVPQDLDSFDVAVQERLKNLERAIINARFAINNRKKRSFPRLNRMLTKLSKRD